MNSTLEKILRGIILWGIRAAMLTPFLISPSLFLPDKFAKAVIFRIIVEIILISYALLALSKKEYRPRFSPLTISVASFWLIGLISTIFSVQPFTSVWGSATRGNGFFNFTHYVIFFFIVIGTVKTSKEWKSIFNFAIFTATIVAFFGILQNLFPSLNAPFMNSSSDRPAGTMGNTIMLSNFLAMLFFITIAFWHREKKTLGKFLYFTSAALIILSIFITKTRGTLMGLTAGGLIFLIIFSFQKINIIKNKKYFIILAIVLIFFSILVFNKNTNVAFGRLFNFDSFNRLTSWKIAVKSIAEKPAFGWGPENFAVPFDKYYPGGYTTSYKNLSETWWDKAHNMPLEIGATMGLSGLAAYLFIFVALFLTLRQSLKKNKNHIIIYALGATIITYFTQNLTSFDSVISQILFFLFLAYAVFLNRNEEQNTGADYIGIAGWKWALWTIISITILLTMIQVSIIPFHLNYKTNKNVVLANENRYTEAIEFYRNTVKQNQGKTYFEKELNEKFMKIASHFIPVLAQDASMTEEYIKLNQEVIELLKNSAKLEPVHTKHYYNIGLFYNNIGTGDPYALSNGLEYFNKALELSPNREQSLIESSKTLLALNDFDGATNRLNKAIFINPQLGEAYFWLGVVNLYKGEISIGEKYLSYAEREDGGAQDIMILKMLAKIFSDMGLFEKTIPYYIKILDQEPKDVDARALLAGTYKKIGNADKAREQAEILLQIAPQAKESIEEFLKNL